MIGVPFHTSRASAQPTAQRLGAGKIDGLLPSVKQRGWEPGAKVMNEKNMWQKTELRTSLTIMFAIREQECDQLCTTGQGEKHQCCLWGLFSPGQFPEWLLDNVWVGATN